ncbi:MAG: hypothetical protein RLY31_2742 [Bacteroidota bacterium]|jgi:hypothetical protein
MATFPEHLRQGGGISRSDREAHPMLYHLLAVCLCTVVSACYQPAEGCLDPLAANYDVSADDDCGSTCCNYPSLKLSFQHRLALPGGAEDGTTFRYDSLYPAFPDTNHLYAVRRARFLLSDLRLVRDDGVAVPLVDRIELIPATGVPLMLTDCFVRADRDIFQPAAAGTWVGSGLFGALRLTLGLPDSLQGLAPDDWPAGHLLREDTLLYEEEDGYLALRMLLLRDTFPDTPVTDVRLAGPRTVDLPFDVPVRIDNGFDVGAILRIRYDRLLEGIDFAADTDDLVGQKMDANLTKAFSVVELKME